MSEDLNRIQEAIKKSQELLELAEQAQACAAINGKRFQISGDGLCVTVGEKRIYDQAVLIRIKIAIAEAVKQYIADCVAESQCVLREATQVDQNTEHQPTE